MISSCLDLFLGNVKGTHQTLLTECFHLVGAPVPAKKCYALNFDLFAEYWFVSLDLGSAENNVYDEE